MASMAERGLGTGAQQGRQPGQGQPDVQGQPPGLRQPEAQQWERALDALEVALARAEATELPPLDWQPPQGLGALPESLLGRAQRLHAEQLRALAELERRRRSAEEQLAALRSIPPLRTDAAIYLDVQA